MDFKFILFCLSPVLIPVTLISGTLFIDLIKTHINNYLENRYLVKNKDMIQKKLDFYFDKYYVDKESRNQIINQLDIYIYRDNLDEYLDISIFVQYRDILYDKLDIYEYNYSKEDNRYKYNPGIRGGSDCINYLKEAMDDKNYKYRKFLIENILSVEKAIKEPIKQIEKINEDCNLSEKEKKKKIEKIRKEILKALDKFHEMYIYIDKACTQAVESKSDDIDNSLFNNIHIYTNTVDAMIDKYKKNRG